MKHPLDSHRKVESILALSYFELLACLNNDSLHPGSLAATQLLLDRCNLVHGERVLEIGCGPGATSRALLRAGVDLTVVDRCPAMLMANAFYCSESGLRIPASYTGSCEALGSYGVTGFDLCIFECVMGFVQNKPLAIKECSAVLTSGGRIGVLDLHYITTPDPELSGALQRIVGPMPPLFEADWKALFQDLVPKIWEAFELPSTVYQSTYEMVSTSYLTKRCPWATDGDIRKIVAHLDEANEIFARNKRHMMGHIGVWSKED
jgi:ubiquinone/menaquinone biosynthesis C-methylase UbiE